MNLKAVRHFYKLLSMASELLFDSKDPERSLRECVDGISLIHIRDQKKHDRLIFKQKMGMKGKTAINPDPPTACSNGAVCERFKIYPRKKIKS